jgi:hypothetical protein
VPLRYNLTLTEALLHQESLYSHVSSYDCWEVGRLVLDAEFRSRHDFLKKCLSLGLECFIKNSNAEMLLASCTHVLSRLYSRFGFSPLAKDICLKDTEKLYTLIYAPIPEVRKKLFKEKIN